MQTRSKVRDLKRKEPDNPSLSIGKSPKRKVVKKTTTTLVVTTTERVNIGNVKKETGKMAATEPPKRSRAKATNDTGKKSASRSKSSKAVKQESTPSKKITFEPSSDTQEKEASIQKSSVKTRSPTPKRERSPSKSITMTAHKVRDSQSKEEAKSPIVENNARRSRSTSPIPVPETQDYVHKETPFPSQSAIKEATKKEIPKLTPPSSPLINKRASTSSYQSLVKTPKEEESKGSSERGLKKTLVGSSNSKQRLHKLRDQVLQFNLSIEGITPQIWRTIQVPFASTLWDLNVAIQDAFGWKSKAAHSFNLTPTQEAEVNLFELKTDKPSWEVKANEYFQNNMQAKYESGPWVVIVNYEGLKNSEENVSYPICVGGARAGPSENQTLSDYKRKVEAASASKKSHGSSEKKSALSEYKQTIDSMVTPNRLSVSSKKDKLLNDFDEFNPVQIVWSCPETALRERSSTS